jgi:hypothetical protein
LIAVSSTGLTLAEPGGGTIEVPRAAVSRARLDFAFGQPRGSKRT